MAIYLQGVTVDSKWQSVFLRKAYPHDDCCSMDRITVLTILPRARSGESRDACLWTEVKRGIFFWGVCVCVCSHIRFGQCVCQTRSLRSERLYNVVLCDVLPAFRLRVNFLELHNMAWFYPDRATV